MKRTLNPERFNQLANDPEVRPWIGGTGEVDLTPTISSLDNFAFLAENDEGGYIYVKLQPGLYIAHTLGTPGKGGRSMLMAMKDSLRAMFLATESIEIVTVVPDGNHNADVWSAHAGFRETFRREKSVSLGGEMVGGSYRSLTYGDWIGTDARNAPVGASFHEEIHRYVPDDHGEDAVHDAWVGATLMGVRENNVGKCVGLYNRWAVHAGYRQLQTISLTPLVVDIGAALLQISATGIEILRVDATARSAPSEIEDEGSLECQLAQPLPLPVSALPQA